MFLCTCTMIEYDCIYNMILTLGDLFMMFILFFMMCVLFFVQ